MYRALLQPAWAAFGTPFGICSSVDELELDADANKSSNEMMEHNEEVPGEDDANKDDCGELARTPCDNEKDQAGDEQT